MLPGVDFNHKLNHLLQPGVNRAAPPSELPASDHPARKSSAMENPAAYCQSIIDRMRMTAAAAAAAQAAQAAQQQQVEFFNGCHHPGGYFILLRSCHIFQM